jgi:hypothetical protein
MVRKEPVVYDDVICLLYFLFTACTLILYGRLSTQVPFSGRDIPANECSGSAVHFTPVAYKLRAIIFMT